MGADFAVITSLRYYDPLQTNYFNTKSTESVIVYLMAISPNAVMEIKSTVRLGYRDKTCETHNCTNLMF